MDKYDFEICDDVNLWRNKLINCYKIRLEFIALGVMVNCM